MNNENTLKKNIAIIFNETIKEVKKIAKPITVSNHPLIISSNPTLISIIGPVPIPNLGIINTRFLESTSPLSIINGVLSDSDKLIKSPKEKKIKNTTIGDTNNSNIILNKIFKEIDIAFKLSNNSKDNSIIRKEIIKSIILNIGMYLTNPPNNLITQTKLPNSALESIAKNIASKLIISESNYNSYDYFTIIIVGILKIINLSN